MEKLEEQKSKFDRPEGIQFPDIRKGRPLSVLAALEQQDRRVRLAIQGMCNAQNPEYGENQRPAGWASAAE